MTKHKTKTIKYTIEEFMALPLPWASTVVDEKLNSAYIGPFTRRYNRLAATYNTQFFELPAVFRKLDLLLASGDQQLVDAAKNMQDASLDAIRKGRMVDDLLGSFESSARAESFVLAAEAAGGWETWPHEPENRAAGGGAPPEERISPVRRNAPDQARRASAFTECHEIVEQEHNIFIPELVRVFAELDKLEAQSASPPGQPSATDPDPQA